MINVVTTVDAATPKVPSAREKEANKVLFLVNLYEIVRHQNHLIFELPIANA